jgi:hypothetical protein
MSLGTGRRTSRSPEVVVALTRFESSLIVRGRRAHGRDHGAFTPPPAFSAGFRPQ